MHRRLCENGPTRPCDPCDPYTGPIQGSQGRYKGRPRGRRVLTIILVLTATELSWLSKANRRPKRHTTHFDRGSQPCERFEPRNHASEWASRGAALRRWPSLRPRGRLGAMPGGHWVPREVQAGDADGRREAVRERDEGRRAPPGLVALQQTACTRPLSMARPQTCRTNHAQRQCKQHRCDLINPSPKCQVGLSGRQ